MSHLRLEPHVALEDVVRDASRRAFFLEALGDERAALERRLAFLSHARAFAALAGRPALLLGAARELVQLYLSEPAALLSDDAPLRVRQLAERVARAVALGRSPCALFAGLEAHVKRQLADDAFPRFLASAHYRRLCDALRSRRELPLGEVLVSRQRTRFLERHLRAQQPAAVGNLRFWVDVQTRFLPLIQTTLFSVALFEEVQAAVRRIYNAYLTASSPSVATVVSDDVRKDTLKSIMTLQGEPFSPPRYAGLFRRAQEQVWEWLQADVYPAFRQRSPLYVLLVVETENLESDRQLRRLSEQVRARAGGASGAAHRKADAKSSSVVVPVVAGLLGAPAARTAAWLHAHADAVPASKFQRVVDVDEPLDAGRRQRLSAFFHSVTPVTTAAAAASSPSPPASHDSSADRRFGVSYDLVCRSTSAAATSHLAYCWNQQTIKALPALLSPSHRAQQPAPKPTVHEFLYPGVNGAIGVDSSGGRGDGEDWSYGVCLTRWRALEFQVAASQSQQLAASMALDNSFLFDSQAENAVLFAPSFVSATSTRFADRRRLRVLLQRLAREDPETLSRDRMQELLDDAEAAQPADAAAVKLKARYSEFYLSNELQSSAMPLQGVFKELSTQTITSLLALLLVERSVVLVSERPSALTAVGQALKEMLLPFQWTHFFLPLCPIATANALASDGFFSSSSTHSAPFIVGFEGVLTYQKQSDSGAVQRHRIRNGIYNVHKVALQLAFAAAAASSGVDLAPTAYARDILQSHAAVVLDIDNDDLYIPGKMDVPEFPHALVRSLEANVKEVLARQHLGNADSQLFQPQTPLALVHEMLDDGEDGQTQSTSLRALADDDAAVDRGARLAFLRFLESLFGDVVYHMCSVEDELEASEGDNKAREVESLYLVFEVDSFLDAHIELGCRELFRQFFQTELFRDFLLRQYAQFALVDLRSSPATRGADHLAPHAHTTP